MTEHVEEPERYLAAQVLKQAVRDNDYSSVTVLSFWCHVVDVEPEAFFERARWHNERKESKDE